MEDFSDDLNVTVSKGLNGRKDIFRRRKRAIDISYVDNLPSADNTKEVGTHSSNVKSWDISAVLSGCLLVTTVIILVFFVVFRKRMDYRMYRIRQRLERRKRRRPGKQSLLEEKHYDVYLSYAESDYPWVLNHLLPHIDSGEFDENKTFEGKFKTYFSDRDAQPGKRELEIVCDNIEQSRKSIVVLSGNYKQKPLHTLELEYMLMCKENLVIQEIILVMTEELNFEQIPEVLHPQIKKEKVLRWENDKMKERKFLKDLIQALN